MSVSNSDFVDGSSVTHFNTSFNKVLDNSILPKSITKEKIKATFEKLLEAIAKVIEDLAKARFLSNHPLAAAYVLFKSQALYNDVIAAVISDADSTNYDEEFQSLYNQSSVTSLVDANVSLLDTTMVDNLEWTYKDKYCKTDCYVACCDYDTKDYTETEYYNSIAPYVDYLASVGSGNYLSSTSATNYESFDYKGGDDTSPYFISQSKYILYQNYLNSTGVSSKTYPVTYGYGGMDYIDAAMNFVNNYSVANSDTTDDDSMGDLTSNLLDDVNIVSGQFQNTVDALFGETNSAGVDYVNIASKDYSDWWTISYYDSPTGESVYELVTYVFGGADTDWSTIPINTTQDTNKDGVVNLDDQIAQINKNLDGWEQMLFTNVYQPMLEDAQDYQDAYNADLEASYDQLTQAKNSLIQNLKIQLQDLQSQSDAYTSSMEALNAPMGGDTTTQ